jgi:hypothetical protein
MKLYVCWGTFQTPRPGGHPCHNAYEALREAGHDPEVIRSYGWDMLPDFLNRSEGRREARRRTGKDSVPLLVTDDDQAIQGSGEIAAWARENPAA